MPGHKGSRIYRENGYGDFLDKIMDCDITEIPGADNLFQTEGIIAETMKILPFGKRKLGRAYRCYSGMCQTGRQDYYGEKQS